MKYIIFLTLVLTGCKVVDIPEIPKEADCTPDGWKVNLQTGEIITDNDTGSALHCNFK